MLGVVYDKEVDDNAVPAVDAAYQSIVFPAPVDADKATVPVPHLVPFVPVAADGLAFPVPVNVLVRGVFELVVVVVIVISAVLEPEVDGVKVTS